MLRVVAMVLFGLMFLAEAVDLYGLFLTLAHPEPVADRFGITVGAGVLRSAVLSILALAVARARSSLWSDYSPGGRRSFTRAPWCARSDTSRTDCIRWLTARCNSARP